MNDEAKRLALLLIPSCAAVLGTRAPGGRVAGATVTWITQASFKPPLIVVALKVGSSAEENVRREKRFALSFLGPAHKAVGQAFFKAPEGAAGALLDHPYELGVTGAPLLVECEAWVECDVRAIAPGGDHAVVVAEVIEAGTRTAHPRPLIIKDAGWRYGG